MFGDDGFSLSEELKRWKKGFLLKHGDMNLDELEGSSTSAASIMQTAQTQPFLGEKRLVVVKNFMRDQKAEEQKELEARLEKLPEETILVIAEWKAPDKRGKLYKTLNKIATLKAFNVPEGPGLQNWASKRARELGVQLAPMLAAKLVAQIGADTWTLNNEIEKLALYSQGHPITEEMIKAISISQLEDSIFTLTDQLAGGRTAAALATLRRLQEQGQEGPFLFAMILRQFRIMAEMKALSEKGTPAPILAKTMGLHPFVVKKTLPHCRHFSRKKLDSTLAQLLVIDRKMKTGGLHLRRHDEGHYLLQLERALLA